MLKIAARSVRGRKQLKRHGNLWMPVQADRCVGCLGGVAGIKLMSIKDRATFWIKVEDDENLMVVERLDNLGRPIPKQGSAVREVPLSDETQIMGAISGSAGERPDGPPAQEHPDAHAGQAERQADVAAAA